MNYNKVNVISNDLANSKEFKPLGDIYITSDLTVNDLTNLVFKLKEDVDSISNNLATYKEHVRDAFSKFNEKFEAFSSSIESNKTATNADINNIKEAIKLLGGVL